MKTSYYLSPTLPEPAPKYSFHRFCADINDTACEGKTPAAPRSHSGWDKFTDILQVAFGLVFMLAFLVIGFVVLANLFPDFAAGLLLLGILAFSTVWGWIIAVPAMGWVIILISRLKL